MMNTTKDIYEKTFNEATALGLNTDKVLEPCAGKFTTYKFRTELLNQAIEQLKKTISVDSNKSKESAKETTTNKARSLTNVVVSTPEGRRQSLSDLKLKMKGTK